MGISLSATQQAVAQQVAAVAQKLGVNPRLAVADAYHESGLNPTAVGDKGTSFGLFQLHKGGELGSLTPQQAYDPTTNATVALSVFAKNQNSYADPGQLAAASERPANPAAYAQAVDSIYNDPALSWLPTSSSGSVSTPNSNLTNTQAPASGSGTAANTVGFSLTNPLGSVTSAIATYWVRAALIITGILIVLIALHGITSNGDNPISVSIDGAQAAGQNAKNVGSRAAGVAKKTGEVAGDAA